MKTILILLVTITASMAQDESTVILTDKRGRTIEAEVISMDEKTVKIRKDGRPFAIKLDTLDADSIESLEPYKPKPKPKGILVHSKIVTRVKAGALGGTFRYFFDVRNYGPKEFKGTVTITLHSSLQGITNGKDTFRATTPIPVDVGRSVFIDSSVGPELIHGDACTASYSWTTDPKSSTFAGTAYSISEEYEDAAQ